MIAGFDSGNRIGPFSSSREGLNRKVYGLTGSRPTGLPWPLRLLVRASRKV